MADSAIHWTDKTWNPTVGCTRVSDGCTHCYAEALAPRLAAMGQSAYEGLTRKHGDGSVTWTGEVRCLPERLGEPLKWRKPARVFVNSMSDLFHESVPDEFIDQVFAVMAMTPWHTYQILTKRPERAAKYLDPNHGERAVHLRVAFACHPRPEALSKAIQYVMEQLPVEDRDWYRDTGEFVDRWPLPNVWLGTSVEDQAAAERRILWLLETPAAVRFISAEPLIGPLDLTRIAVVKPEPGDDLGVYLNALTSLLAGPDEYLDGRPHLNWVITGAESGPQRRPFDEDWARSIRDQCQAAGVAYFHKQGSGPRPGMNRELDGQLWEQFPESARRAGAGA